MSGKYAWSNNVLNISTKFTDIVNFILRKPCKRAILFFCSSLGKRLSKKLNLPKVNIKLGFSLRSAWLQTPAFLPLPCSAVGLLAKNTHYQNIFVTERFVVYITSEILLNVTTSINYCISNALDVKKILVGLFPEFCTFLRTSLILLLKIWVNLDFSNNHNIAIGHFFLCILVY